MVGGGWGVRGYGEELLPKPTVKIYRHGEGCLIEGGIILLIGMGASCWMHFVAARLRFNTVGVEVRTEDEPGVAFYLISFVRVSVQGRVTKAHPLVLCI